MLLSTNSIICPYAELRIHSGVLGLGFRFRRRDLSGTVTANAHRLA
jgi:hypothetical protein